MKRQLIIGGIATGIFIGGNICGFEICKRIVMWQMKEIGPIVTNIISDVIAKDINGSFETMTDEELKTYLQTELDFYNMVANNMLKPKYRKAK